MELKLEENRYTYFFSIYIIYLFLTLMVWIAEEDRACNIENKNPILKAYNKLYGGNEFVSYFVVIISFLVILLSVYQATRYSQLCLKTKITGLGMMILIGMAIVLFFAVSFIMLFFHESYKEVGENKFFKYFVFFFSYLFYGIIGFFLWKTKDVKGFEVGIVIFLLFTFGLAGFIRSQEAKNAMVQGFKKNKYNFLVLNCMNSGSTTDLGSVGEVEGEDGIESFANRSMMRDPSLLQYNSLTKEKGNNYILLKDNVPIQFMNPVSNKYQDFILSDFYYPGSYYTYIEDSPVQGHPSYEAIKLALTKYKVRIVHLDVFPSKNDMNMPSVRCLDMAKDATELSFVKCLKLIEKYGWENQSQKYPLFLFLNFQGNTNDKLFNQVYRDYLDVFKGRIPNKKYGFGGRNGTFPISKAPMREFIEKVILLTNIYPTRTVLDELIQGGNVLAEGDGNGDGIGNINMNIELYKESYVNFDSVGIGQDRDKTKLYVNHQRNMSFFYTLPNMEKVTPNENKSGLYNPNFQDVAQYGIQGTMMYLFVPDMNLNNWYMFFKSMNNMYPVLKDETLLALEPEKQDLKEQKPITGLQKPQKYCVIPGFMDTEKSNLTTGVENNSCGNSD